MAYRIIYREENLFQKMDTLRWDRILGIGTAAFLVFCLLVTSFWPAGREVLREWIYPGDPEITRRALLRLASGLMAGEELGESVAVFCREILNGA